MLRVIALLLTVLAIGCGNNRNPVNVGTEAHVVEAPISSTGTSIQITGTAPAGKATESSLQIQGEDDLSITAQGNRR